MNPAMNSAVNAGMAPVATPFFFYLLAWLAVLIGLAVITRRNAVHSALALIVTLLSVAGLYLMLYAPFVAGVQIIVYAGGIAFAKGRALFPDRLMPLPEASNTQQVAVMLYGEVDKAGLYRMGQYTFAFEIASLLLLVAILGAVIMTKKKI